ncbi:RluA family pseudouridine synthase [Oricola cellulosilytica]|uniref:Pseudouridine synthase n=1 Tax=Oricola cellulosilytica TaxID=1429082 RepID=A0A4R0PGN2_9HYPH|nr:RluA family pseudouridine synthase [Oricola cellulosilytica]TCD15525.1 RluA family pseudouridine synthase [Oricola cellulosilytica]
MKAFAAGETAAGQRLDQWLAVELAGTLSRSRIKALIESGEVEINGVTVFQPRRSLRAGDDIRVHLPEPEQAAPAPEAIPLVILFEDNDVVVVDKPAGLVVHPGAGNPSGTLVNALLHHCGDSLSGIGGVKRPGIVHRLDKETSGVMVVAKNDLAHKSLSAQFADHGKTTKMERTYLALVWGAPDVMNGRIESHVGRSSHDRMKQAVVSESQTDARHAVTHFRTVERFGDPTGANTVASLISCTLETGRTHQIRVHMAHIGHPLIGDHGYGKGFSTKAQALAEPLRGRVIGFRRQALHAASLAFEHPSSGELMKFESPMPSDMTELISSFRDML